MLEDIPKELLCLRDQPEDVSIIIGENGCGKSTLLKYLGKYYLDRGECVVGIANSIHDKFDIRGANFYALKCSRGRRLVKETIRNSIINISKHNDELLRNVSKVLDYVGFDPMIGFKVNEFNKENVDRIYSCDKVSDDLKEEIVSNLYKLNFNKHHSRVIWLKMIGYDFTDFYFNSLSILFSFESLLKKLEIISGIELFLSKDNTSISLLNASSGELSLITSIVFLSTVIKFRKTVILIDEPENSLHPKWQREYAKVILDLFYYYQPKIIIATHSPIIVSGTECNVEKTSVYKAADFKFSLQKENAKNIEEMYYDLFGVTTPENRFLSSLLVKCLNDLSHEKLNKESFKRKMDDIYDNVYDEKQKNMISAIKIISDEI